MTRADQEYVRAMVRGENPIRPRSLDAPEVSTTRKPSHRKLSIRTSMLPFQSVSHLEAAQERISDLVQVWDKFVAANTETHGRALVTHIKALKDGARKRNLEFTLTDDEMAAMMKAPCAYCGLLEKHHYNGIDRVDNLKGYVQENSVPCCRWCNYAKGKRRVEDFMGWLRWVAIHAPVPITEVAHAERTKAPVLRSHDLTVEG